MLHLTVENVGDFLGGHSVVYESVKFAIISFRVFDTK